MWQSSQYWTDERRWWRCRNCGHWQLELPPQGLDIPPKILYFDIETSTVSMNIDVFDMQVRSGWLDWHDITESFYVICWAACWVNKKNPRVYGDCVTPAEAKKRDDKRCLTRLWDLLDEADYVCGHNSKAFDVKKVEARFMLNNMGTPAEFRQKDTLTEAKKRFKTESQALDYWAKLLNIERKVEMVKKDWKMVNAGDAPTLRKMSRYNRGDVRNGAMILKRFREHIESNGTRMFR